MTMRVLSSTGPPKPMPTPRTCERSSLAWDNSSGTAAMICLRIPSAPAAASTDPRQSATIFPSPSPSPICSFVPPISMPRNISGQNFFNHMPMHIRQSSINAIVTESEAGVIDTEQVKHGGVQVVAVGWMFYGAVGPFVAFAGGDAAADDAAGQPAREGVRVVIAA